MGHAQLLVVKRGKGGRAVGSGGHMGTTLQAAAVTASLQPRLATQPILTLETVPKYSNSPLDSVSKIQITSVLHMLLVVRRRPQIIGTNDFSLGASCFLARQAKSLRTVICGGI